jgi:hypothetical protein
VIARNDDLGPRKRVEIGARFAKLARFRPLRQVTRNHHYIGLEFPHGPSQRLEHGGIDAAEMQIGEVGDGAHDSAFAPVGVLVRNEHPQRPRPYRIHERGLHHRHLTVSGDVQALVPCFD